MENVDEVIAEWSRDDAADSNDRDGEDANGARGADS